MIRRNTTKQHIENTVNLLKNVVPDGISKKKLCEELGISQQQWQKVDYGLNQFPVGYDDQTNKYYWVGR